MSFLDRLRGRKPAAPETRAGFGGPSFSLGAGAYSGPITPWQAENLSTVTAVVNAIAGGIAALPMCVYQAIGDAGRVEVPNHPVARLLRAPNRYQTGPDWIEFMVAQMLLWGNALSVIETDTAGRPIALTPIPWQRVNVSLLPSGALAYDVVMWTTPLGSMGTARRFLDSDVLHLRDRSDDGFIGRSRLSRAPDVLSSAIGVQGFAANVWSNAATPSGMVSLPANISPDGKRRIEAFMADHNTGPSNAGRVLFVDADSKFTPLSISPEDAQTLESRKFSVEEICRLFNCPPPIVQDYSNNTFTNSAQANTWFATNTLTPICRKIEAEFARSVFADPSGDYHIEIDLSGLMRGDYATRWAANVAAVTAGILTADEVRAAEGYGPKPAADPASPAPVA